MSGRRDGYVSGSKPPLGTPGFHEGIAEAAYHADRKSLSVSGAKLLLKAPALYRWEQEHPAKRQVWDDGSAAHALVLGAGMESIYVTPAEDFRSGHARAERDEARRVGLAIVTASTWQRVCDMADALSSHALAMRLLADGKPEVSAYALDEPTGVMRRGRFDWLGTTILTDYKTCADVSPGGFAAACARYDYAMQADWYLRLARDLGHPAEAFAFIAQSKEAPYLVEVYELDADALALGARKNRAALERYRDCVESDLWPGYTGQEFTTISLPRWAFTQEVPA